ncbi:MAG: hypothetical protein COW65_05485 [Cytophagales bacterium CG18_big_fil_WC_8_21_14_2_50_42_9]|nr:MAG: hypothetical protein COW65_05485 [Cytophagales bacterium CG18_big_fil_WC_8_21_14_2_50_42_9]
MPISNKKTSPEGKSSNKELTITKQKQQLLSKPQQAFNRLVKKIEKLRHQITSTEQILNEKLTYYSQHLHPLEQELVHLRKQVVKLLFPFYTDKKTLTKKQKQVLKGILVQQVNDIFSFSNEEPDEELKQVFEALEGMKYEDAEKQDLENMKDEMSAMFESFSFKMNFDDLHENMSEEEMGRKMQEMEEQFFQQAENLNNRQSTRKKTKKQLEKEERERQAAEIKNKSISRIYKQLAKALHPDLERDAAQKARKEALMQELTTAYENNDLHTLLRLELEWIQKEETNLYQLTDEKLSIYNEVLKEQVAELEAETYMQLEHPRYQPLLRFVMFPEQLRTLNLKREQQDLNEILKSLQKSISRLEGESALLEIKELVEYFRRN